MHVHDELRLVDIVSDARARVGLLLDLRLLDLALRHGLMALLASPVTIKTQLTSGFR